MPDIPEQTYLLGIVALAAYLLGSIPFGLLVARMFGLGDVRQIGSGNIGATNVLRTGNKSAAAATLVLDALKGAVAVLIAKAAMGEAAAQVAGLAAFLGHCFPVWLRFKGGKGVATFIGVIYALSWPVGIAVSVTWIAVVAIFRWSSMGALLAAGLAPVWAIILGYGAGVVLLMALCVLVYIRHSANISRLRVGTEPKIGKAKSG
ncbi:glycerol-3-phosphate 1-O-acyltransferase PlsY [Aestuariibius insulae]|uniref:glycerol-3-phosphate 1-O-acyltransferase PlsY n=1 Tax=Aestuariibius insulae TaxID=2058287 RepID=UPI00345E78FA